jgi:hypothetical protein
VNIKLRKDPNPDMDLDRYQNLKSDPDPDQHQTDAEPVEMLEWKRNTFSRRNALMKKE